MTSSGTRLECDCREWQDGAQQQQQQQQRDSSTSRSG
eukprot:CAMPEP_0177503338 /NCGR_PEP_ID=MMETSP0369-20130122/38253_1 /TAXON_ID=447022 ORGANISM="Scrippsiella hangoei-like, Strain SHHI-4" /NCGR_SAMPLE_ID=MMETSP0369 /ASSEMBLY_ACC=CAM_ASM_000364 /LENGTH=36 /DNA_ID= /DNA_START= /DNA_END= /DNA_ORIENTATION=